MEDDVSSQPHSSAHSSEHEKEKSNNDLHSSDDGASAGYQSVFGSSDKSISVCGRPMKRLNKPP